jgi:diacylglycerol kinase family enzyme
MNRHCHLLVNPAAGGYTQTLIDQVVSILKSGGISPELFMSRSAEDLRNRVKAVTGTGIPPLLLVAGGDGTINDVINSLAAPGATIGVIPVGTANVLAKEIGVSSVVAASERIVSGKARDCTTGVISQGTATRRFILMAGIGFDGQVVHGVSTAVKKVAGKGAYVAAALKVLLAWDTSRLVVQSADVKIDCHSVIFCNASRYGGNMVLARAAGLFTPGLVAVCIQANSRFNWFMVAVRLVLSQRCPPGCSIVTGEQFKIAGSKPVQVDGDPSGFTPLEVSTEAGFVRMIC